MIFKNFFKLLLCFLLFPLMGYGAPPKKEFEDTLSDIPASMGRLLGIRGSAAEGGFSLVKRPIFTKAKEVAGLMEFEEATNTFRISLRGVCNSQWVQILNLAPTPEPVSLFKGNVRAHVRAGVFDVYKELFYPEGTLVISNFIESLVEGCQIINLADLRIQIEGDSSGGSLCALAAGDFKAFLLEDWGVTNPHLRIVTYGAPFFFNKDGARLYQEYMGAENILHLNFQGVDDLIVHHTDRVFQNLADSPLLDNPIIQVGIQFFLRDYLLPGTFPQIHRSLKTLQIRQDYWTPLGIQIDVPSFEGFSFSGMLANLNLSNISELGKAFKKMHDLKSFYMTSLGGDEPSRVHSMLALYIAGLRDDPL